MLTIKGKAMKKLIFALFLCVLSVSSAYAASGEVFSMMGTPDGQTTRIVTTNSSALLKTVYDAANGGTAVDWARVRAVLISAETYDARISIGVAAENDETPVGHLLIANTSARFVGRNICNALYIISKTDDQASVLMVTIEY